MSWSRKAEFLFLLLCLASTHIYAQTFRIVPSTKSSQQTQVSANFPFDPPLQVEILDGSNNRITSGTDSDLVVVPILSNETLCLSVDSSFQLSAGVGTFSGSVCDVVSDPITISFVVQTSTGNLTSDSSNAFTVTGDIHLAYFSKNRRYAEGHFEQFFRQAVEDVNTGEFRNPFRKVFPDRQIKVKTYYYGETPGSYVKTFFEMENFHKQFPEQKAHSIIGFSNNDVSKALLPLTTLYKYAVLSYQQDSLSMFSDKVIIKGPTDRFDVTFYEKAKNFGVNIVKEYTVPLVTSTDAEPTGGHDAMFESVKELGIRVIVSTVKGEAAHYLHAEAVHSNLTSSDGFQWVGYKNREDFPSSNLPANCHIDRERLCNFRFKGMVFNEPLILVDGWDTPEWNTVWLKHMDHDMEKVLGNRVDFPQYDISGEGATYGLTYDSVVVQVNGLERLINAKKTVTGASISQEIRSNTKLHGLTGELELNTQTGDRANYIARSTVLWPNEEYFQKEFQSKIDLGTLDWWDWGEADEWVTNTVYVVQNTSSTSVIERKTPGSETSLLRIYNFNDVDAMTGYISLSSSFKNNRTFKAYKGIFHYDRQTQVEYNINPYVADVLIPLEVETRTEEVPASYYCTNGCGGKQTDPEDINKYENGECVSQDKCSCLKSNSGNDLWTGPSCNMAVCSSGCTMGTCVSPDNCVCLTGWEGVDCSAAKCSSCSAAGGKCTSPEVCKCNPGQFGSSCQSKCTCDKGKCNEGLTGDGKCSSCESGYIGSNCDISLIGLLVPTIIGGILIILGLYFAAQFFIKRAHLRAALLNNDWIVDWTDVKKHDEATGKSSMFLSALSMNRNSQNKKQANTAIWEGIDCYYQKLEKDSVNLTDAIRLEVKHMRDMRHINIAPFVGCCLDAPNVCILTELQPKGSLDDILSNEDIKLPWNFRFALVKGMCKGLEYIHNGPIRSHGRLKSSNCLIDNRWTIKLTGFGLSELKAGQRTTGVFNPHNPDRDPDPGKSNYGSLLWTPPEILQRGVFHIDHIGRGTTEGDIYSLGMVMSEMCTRDVPFADVMLEKKELIDLICGLKTPTSLKVWNDYIAKLNIEQGGPVRPCIKDKEWPSKYEKRKALKKLMENCWHDDPVHRPTLREVCAQLEVIEPQRGELMDLLVSMLEKYSSNLEDIVAKRTKQLSKEKQKTEDLVSRLLPRSVADELKQGRRVAPVDYEFVTIYFSDIVGFTSIAKASTPLEVVALLNDMYTTFDGIAANYDVYKVETIGDAYMIVSGLPTKNGDNHAGEICTTALDLMCAIGQFKIAHMPDMKMKLRAGIHTGSVVAGVVGLKMPRYCLFGDSVNVASKMESSGKALRIQLSEDTFEILRRLGGYKCDFREEIEVKDRMIKTYWLSGKHGYEKKLPEISPEDL